MVGDGGEELTVRPPHEQTLERHPCFALLPSCLSGRITLDLDVHVTTRARGEVEFSSYGSGRVASVKGESVDAAPGVHVGGMVGAIELVLDAEVLELIKHVVGIVGQLLRLVQQLLQRRAADLPFLVRCRAWPARIAAPS